MKETVFSLRVYLIAECLVYFVSIGALEFIFGYNPIAHMFPHTRTLIEVAAWSWGLLSAFLLLYLAFRLRHYTELANVYYGIGILAGVYVGNLIFDILSVLLNSRTAFSISTVAIGAIITIYLSWNMRRLARTSREP